MKLAYLSPFAPVRSGVSEYSADLCPELAKLADLRLFSDVAEPTAVGQLTVEPMVELDAAAVDLAIYHMGNNLHHRFVYDYAVKRPGLLVLHDLVLHHFFIEETLARGDRDGYIELMSEAYGTEGELVARGRIHEISSDLNYFVYPLFEGIVAASRGVIVHNERAARLIRGRVTGVPVRTVAMGIPAASDDPLPSACAARQELGVSDDDLVIGMFGFTTPIKRPDVVLRAFAELAHQVSDVRLVIVGEISPGLNLDRLATDLGVADRLQLTGYLPYEVVKHWVAATDIFMNLRYPTAGETSASLLRLLGWGKMVIVSDYAQFREIPDDVALRVPIGDGEVETLAGHLIRLAESAELRGRFESKAAAHVATRHRLDAAARDYVEMASEIVAAPPTKPRVRRPRAPLYGDRPTSRAPRTMRCVLAAGEVASKWCVGETVTLDISAENTGDTIWLRESSAPGGYVVLFGLLRNQSGGDEQTVAWGALPRDILPGGKVTLQLSFTVPANPGLWEFVVDLDNIGWGPLHWRGSEALVYHVTISDEP